MQITHRVEVFVPEHTEVKNIQITIPGGYHLVATGRHPELREPYLYIDDLGRVDYLMCYGCGFHTSPKDRYIILRKKVRKVVTFTSTGEVRVPKAGEWYPRESLPGGFIAATWNYDPSDKRNEVEIYERSESTL